MKLRNKLFIGYLAVGLIPLLLIGVYANIYLKREKFQEISEPSWRGLTKSAP